MDYVIKNKQVQTKKHLHNVRIDNSAEDVCFGALQTTLYDYFSKLYKEKTIGVRLNNYTNYEVYEVVTTNNLTIEQE